MLAVWILVASQLGAQKVSTLSAGELDAVFLYTIATRAPGVARSDAVAALGEALSANTDLTLREPELLGLDARDLETCDEARRFACWTAIVGGAAERLRYLIVLASQPTAAGSLVFSTMLIDLERARTAIGSVAADQPGAAELVENRIFEGATIVQTSTLLAEQTTKALFTRLVEGAWRERFVAAGHWQRHGRITVQSKEESLLAELDGRVIGEVGRGTTILTQVRTGTRALAFFAPGESPGRGRISRTVWVTPDGAAQVEVAFAPRVDLEHEWVRPATIVTGISVGIGGLVIGALGAVPAGRGVLSVCRGADCGRVGAKLRTPCDLGAGDPSCAAEGGGLLLVPLGLGLLAAGASWALGGLFLDDGEWPWAALALGTLLGATTYAIGAALDVAP